MKLAPEEMAWLFLWLEDHRKKMPGARSQPPHYDATSWDIDDIFRALRQDAVCSRERLWQAVSERATTGAWPKMKPADSFWLRQRWAMATRYCREALEENSRSANRTVVARCPTDARAAIKWLLLDEWDRRLADIWIRENARDCVGCDWPEDSEEGLQKQGELERYFRKLGA